MAYSQIKFFGFNETVGLLSFEQNEGQRQGYSKKLQAQYIYQDSKLLAAPRYSNLPNNRVGPNNCVGKGFNITWARVNQN